MKFLWQQRVLLLVSAQLLVTPVVASSFVTPTTTSAMKSPAFTNKSGRYNPLLHVTPGGDDSASPEASEPVVEPEACAPGDIRANENMGPNACAPGYIRSKLPGLPWHRLPDYLTYARCLAIPVFVGLFYSKLANSHIYTGIIFALASVTDWLDGFLARRWDVSTACKSFLKTIWNPPSRLRISCIFDNFHISRFFVCSCDHFFIFCYCRYRKKKK